MQTLRSTPTQPSPSLKNLLLALTQPLSSGTVVPVNLQKPLARETTAPLALKSAPTQPSAPLKDFLLALTQPLPSGTVVPVNLQKPLAREITVPLALKPAPTQQTASLKNLLLALAQPLPSVLLEKTETETTLPHLSPITSKSEPVLPFESKNTLVSPAKVENRLQETLLSILPIEENPLSVVSPSIVAQDIVSERLETTEKNQPSTPVLSKAFGAKEIQKNYGEEPSLQTPRDAELSSSDPTLFLTVSDQPRNGDSHSFVEKSIEFLLPPSLETLEKDKNLSHEELAHEELSLSLFTTEYALVEQGTEFLTPMASKILEKGQEHQHTEHTHTTPEDLFILGERNLELLPPVVGKILESAQELPYEELRLGTALEDSPDIVPVFTQSLPRQDVERHLEKSTPQPGTIKLHIPVEHDSKVLVPERANTLNTDQEPLFEEFVHSSLKTLHTLVDQRDELLPPVASKILEKEQEPLFEELGLDTILEDNSEIDSVFAHHFLNPELEEDTPQHNTTTPHVRGEQRDELLTSGVAKTVEKDLPHEELPPVTILTDKHEPDVFEHRNKLGSSHVLDIDVSPTLHPRLFTSLGSPVLKPQMPPSLGLTAGSTHLVRHTLKAHLTKGVSHLPLTHGTHDLVPLKAIGVNETLEVPLQTLPPVTLSTADVIQTQDLGLVPVKSQALRMSTSQRTPGSMVSWTLNLANFGIKIPGAPREVTFSIDPNSLTKTSRRDPLSLGFVDSLQKGPLVLSSGSTFKVQTDQDIYTFDLTFSTPDVQSHTMTVSLNSDSFNELAAFVTTPLALKTSEGVQGELVAHRGVSSQGPQTLLHRLLTALNRGTASVTSTSPVPSWIRKTFEGLPTFLRGDSVKPTTQRSLTGSLLGSTSHPSNALVRGGSSQPLLTLAHQVEEVVSLHSPQTYTPIPDILSAVHDLGVSPGASKTPVQTRQPSSLPLPQELVVAPAKQPSSTIDTPLTLDLATLGIHELPGSTLSVTPDSLRHASLSTDTDEEAYTVEATLSVPDTQPIRLPIVLQSEALQELTALMSAPLSEKVVSIPRSLSLKPSTSPIALPEKKLASNPLQEQEQSEDSLDTIFAPLDLFLPFEEKELDDDIITVHGDHNKKEPFAIRTVSLDSPAVQTRFSKRSLRSVSTPLWTTHTDSPEISSFEERGIQNTLTTTPETPQRKASLSSSPTTPETLSPARDYQPVTPDSLTNSPRDYGTPLSPNTLRLLREAATRIIEGVSHAQRFVSPVLNITPLSDKKSSTPSDLLSPARDTQPKTPDSILSPALNREPVTPPLSSSDKKSSTPSDLSPALNREPKTPDSVLSPAQNIQPKTPDSVLSPARDTQPRTPDSVLSPARDTQPRTPDSVLSPAQDTQPRTPDSVLSPTRKEGSGTRSLNKKKSKAPALQPRTPNERNLTPESSSKASQKTKSPKVSPKFIKRKGKENILILTDEQ